MPACFNDVKVLWISRFDYKKDWILSPHTHKEFYQLIYCFDGACTVEIEDRKCSVSAPAVLFFPPGIQHGIRNISAKGLKTLDTKFMVHAKRLGVYCKKLPNIIKTVSDEIYHQLENIHDNGTEQDLLYEEKCQLLLGQILIELIRKSRNEKITVSPLAEFIPEKKFSALVSKTVNYIKNHYPEKINAEILEKEMFYSYRYLSKFFRKEMSMTPVQFAEKFKILKAEELLKNTEFEIKYISETLGYQNIHDFSRSFKKNTGIPPSQWRDTARLDICKDIVIHSGFKNILFIEKSPS